MATGKQNHQTQWAAQFYAAAELTRRGNLVSLTLGNAPSVDLVVISPSGKPYQVQVKGLMKHNFWLIKKHVDVDPELYFILVLVPDDPACRPDYFILSDEQVITEMDPNYFGNFSGLNWGQAVSYRDRWDTLPA